MAFNPLNTFHKNKRFWMAMILMVCMVSFVFCTGLKGDMQERILAWFGKRGDTIARVGRRNVTSKDLYDLKQQREVANHLLKVCVTESFNKISKRMFDEEKKPVNDKDLARRRQELTQLEAFRDSLAERKIRPFYFESGFKFDDLLDFITWQAQADALGIHLEPEQINRLLQQEFYGALSPEEIFYAEQEVKRSHFRDASQEYILHAIGEEFRVKIAQYAVMTAQPASFFFRGKKAEDFGPKLSKPDIPDEIRAPLTLAQLWDIYKTQRAEFDVTLVPIHVEDFISKMREPTLEEQEKYFNANNKVFDPTAPNRGVEVPSSIKIEFVYADPTSPAYLEQQKIKALLNVTNPFAYAPMQSPVLLAASYLGSAELEIKRHLQDHYAALSRSKEDRYSTSSLGAGAGTSAMAAYFSHKYPQAAAGVLAGSFLTPTDGLGALAGYMAWGATKHPDEIAAGSRAEMTRRVPFYASMIPTSSFNQPLETVNWLRFMNTMIPAGDLPIEVVQSEIRDLIARRNAEEAARAGMKIVRTALSETTGDAEKVKRVLNRLVPEFKLTYGPTGEAKTQFYHRYNIEDAKEFAPLKEAYAKQLDMINFFEGRDLKPGTILKSGDYYKMFFSNEAFAASSPYHAMPWPPVVQPNNERAWKNANPRLINPQNIDEGAAKEFRDRILQGDPRQAAPSFDLFDKADKPILFWRTEQTAPTRPAEFKAIAPDLAATRARLAQIPKDLERLGQINQEIVKTAVDSELRKKLEVERAALKPRSELIREEGELKLKERDLMEITSKVIEGWKFEQARAESALPKAKALAEKLVESKNDPNILLAESKTLKRDLIPLKRISKMSADRLPNFSIDYFEYTVPKDAVQYPRDDMGQQLVSLYDLKEPIEVKDTELDKINKTLYGSVKGEKEPQGRFVQVLTNKPRSVFYVAVVTALPKMNDRVGFIRAIESAPFERPVFARDHFVTRAQQQAGREMRAGIVRHIRETIGFSIDDEKKARDQFDRVSSD